MSAAALAAITPGSQLAKDIALLFSGLIVHMPVRNYIRVMGAKWAQKNNLRTGAGSAQLSVSASLSRFSSAGAGQQNKKPPFTVIYAAKDLATACFEGLMRDRYDLSPNRLLTNADYNAKCAVNISCLPGQSLALIDLTNGKGAGYGVPTDISRYSNHQDGQYFADFIHREMPHVEGILYPSRFTDQFCVAIFTGAFAKLTAGPRPVSLSRALIAGPLARWNMSVQ